jgi:type II secretory pathway pseudopilin PulG
VNITAVSGFTYVMVLAAVVVVGILAQAAVPLSSHIAQADREAELLFRGQAYRNAIKSYYEAGKPIKAFPRALEDLLDDPRFPRKRHLRAPYPDPLARDGKGEWTLVRAADGGISGVASTGGEEPLKQANFPPGLEDFAGAKAYSEWVFEYRPTATPSPPAPALQKTL